VGTKNINVPGTKKCSHLKKTKDRIIHPTPEAVIRKKRLIHSLTPDAVYT